MKKARHIGAELISKLHGNLRSSSFQYGSHLDGLDGVATLLVVPLHLPVELNLRGDVNVDLEVHESINAGIVEGVETLEDNDGGGLDGLVLIEGAVDVVVDGLGDALALLHCLNLLIHELEVVLAGIQGSQASNLAALAVVNCTDEK
jgi:hypothetical protein